MIPGSEGDRRASRDLQPGHEVGGGSGGGGNNLWTVEVSCTRGGELRFNSFNVGDSGLNESRTYQCPDAESRYAGAKSRVSSYIHSCLEGRLNEHGQDDAVAASAIGERLRKQEELAQDKQKMQSNYSTRAEHP